MLKLLNDFVGKFSENQENLILKNNTNKNFDDFVKKMFVEYLNNSNLFNRFAKIYDIDRLTDKPFLDECKQLYFLTDKVFDTVINKSKVLFDIQFNKNSLKKNDKFYIFDIKDIKNNSINSYLFYKDKTEKQQNKRFACKIVAITFIRLYILLKGIFITFNYDLNYKKINKKEDISENSEEKVEEIQEDTSKNIIEDVPEVEAPLEKELEKEVEKEKVPENAEELPENVEEVVEKEAEEKEKEAEVKVELEKDKQNDTKIGGGLFDNLFTFFKDDSKKSKEEELNDEVEKKINDVNEVNQVDEVNEEDVQDEVNDKNEVNDEVEDNLNDENEELKEENLNCNIKNCNLNNIVFIFLNSVYHNIKNKDDEIEEGNIEEKKVRLDENIYKKNAFPSFKQFIKNINDSKIFDILCDDKLYDKIVSKNIIFNQDNIIKEIYKKDKAIKEKLSNLDTKISEEYSDMINNYNDKNKKLKEKIEKIFTKKYKENVCDVIKKDGFKLVSNYSEKDETEIFEKIKKEINKMFNDYTDNRNLLYDNIISNIFSIKDKKIEKIKDNITYVDIFRYTYKSKIILMDLYITFFEHLKNIFDILIEKYSLINLRNIEKAPVEELPEEIEQASEKVEEVPEKVEVAPEKVEVAPEKVEEVPEKVEEVPEKVQEVPEKVEEVPEKKKEIRNTGGTRKRKKSNYKKSKKKLINV